MYGEYGRATTHQKRKSGNNARLRLADHVIDRLPLFLSKHREETMFHWRDAQVFQLVVLFQVLVGIGGCLWEKRYYMSACASKNLCVRVYTFIVMNGW